MKNQKELRNNFSKYLLWIPNTLTASRIVLSIVLLLIDHGPRLSVPFYIIYGICGFTDMIDGTVARKMGVQSKFGNKLDTLADAVFVLTMIGILCPIVYHELPRRTFTKIIIWTVVIMVLKFTAWVSGGMRDSNYAPPHTILDKLVGTLLFLYPFARIITAGTPADPIVIYILCGAATLAAIEKWIKITPDPVKAKEQQTSPDANANAFVRQQTENQVTEKQEDDLK